MSETNPVHLSLVIPAHNEAKRLPSSLRHIWSFFRGTGISMEVIVIVEKSKDHTLEVGQDTVEGNRRFKVIDNAVRRGKGYAVRTGMLMAKGDFVFFMDADLSTPLTEVISFLNYFRSYPEVQVLVGSRAHEQSEILCRQHPVRENMGRIFNRLVQAFVFKGIEDTQCGFKAFTAEACKEIFSRQKLNGFAFDVEVLMLARQLGYSVQVLPVKWINSPESKVRIVRDSLRMLWELSRVRWLVGETLQRQPPSRSLPQ